VNAGCQVVNWRGLLDGFGVICRPHGALRSDLATVRELLMVRT
jgi:hypothetical protein